MERLCDPVASLLYELIAENAFAKGKDSNRQHNRREVVRVVKVLKVVKVVKVAR